MSSAPTFELLDIPADVGIIYSNSSVNQNINFCNELLRELESLRISAYIYDKTKIEKSIVEANLYVILADPNFPHVNKLSGNCILILLDGADFSDFDGFEYPFARLTTDKKMKDAQCLAKNIHSQFFKFT